MVMSYLSEEALVSERPARAGALECARTETLPVLLSQLVHALLRTGFDLVPITAINRIIAGCALVALVAPLLLWISWSKAGFFIIIGTAATAVGIIYLLIWLYPDDPF
jgi:hypothetical protein